MRLNVWSVMVVMVLVGGLFGGCKDNGSGSKPTPSGGSKSLPAAPAASATPAGPVAGTGGGKPQIGFIMQGGDARVTMAERRSVNKALHAGAEKAVAEGRKGVDGTPVIGLMGREPENGGEQVAVAKELLEKGVAAIVIAPEDKEMLSGVVAAAGCVPVVAIATDWAASGEVDGAKAVIASDPQKAADLSAQRQLAKPGRTEPGLAFAAQYKGLYATVSAEDVAKIKEGKTDVLYIVDPREVGALAVKTAVACIKEQKVEKRIDVPWHEVTRENMDSPEIAPLLHP
ncbi:MAG: hypothetical protein FWD61_09815 [Phycisphaerales bacterium]|nr:hypothetical protein [Phycisphaerales bacterium]